VENDFLDLNQSSQIIQEYSKNFDQDKLKPVFDDISNIPGRKSVFNFQGNDVDELQ
jgi:hypothetical protein